MKEILWLDEDLSKTKFLGLDYIGTYIGTDYTILEIDDTTYNYLLSLGRYHSLYIVPDFTIITPHGSVYIGKCEIEGWNFIADNENFAKDTSILSSFDEDPPFEAVHAESLKEYFEKYLGIAPEDDREKTNHLFALAKLNKMSVSDLLWKIERSNYNVSLVENYRFTY